MFRLAHGHELSGNRIDTRRINAEPTGPWPGAPLEPTGDPMLDGVGPAAYARARDTPDLTIDGAPRSCRCASRRDFTIADGDPDPRGMPVLGADGVTGALVADVWVDRSEPQIRYLEVEVGTRRGAAAGRPRAGRQAAPPRRGRDRSSAASSPTCPGCEPGPGDAAEEDRISGYYGGGKLYAEPSRTEPLI